MAQETTALKTVQEHLDDGATLQAYRTDEDGALVRVHDEEDDGSTCWDWYDVDGTGGHRGPDTEGVSRYLTYVSGERVERVAPDAQEDFAHVTVTLAYPPHAVPDDESTMGDGSYPYSDCQYAIERVRRDLRREFPGASIEISDDVTNERVGIEGETSESIEVQCDDMDDYDAYREAETLREYAAGMMDRLWSQYLDEAYQRRTRS